MTRVAETASATGRFHKLRDDFKLCLHDRYKHQLRDTRADFNFESGITTIPTGDQEFALVIGVNETDQVTQHDAMFMAQSRARNNHGCQLRICDVYR